MQRLQNFAAKVALGRAAKHDHVTPYLKELGWLKISQKHNFELGIIVYNVINTILPQWLLTLLTVSDMNEHDVNTRQKQYLYVPKCNTSLGSKSLQVAGPSFWNTLHNDVKEAHSLPSFKNCFKMHLLRHQF